MTAGLLCSVRRKQELSLKVSKHPNNIKLIIKTTKINSQQF